jgi:hypothetical protein
MSNQNALYEIITRMDKEDYRKFSYIGIFKNIAKTILLIVVLAAAGAGLGAMMDGSFHIVKFLLTWLILIVTAFAAIFLRVEYKAFNREGLVKVGLKGNRQYLDFFENYLTASEDLVKTSSKIKYEKLLQVMELDNYFMIYAGPSSASMIRKKDIDKEDLDGFRNLLKNKMGSRYKDITKK